MTIEITEVEDENEWNQHVDRAEHTTPFHRYEALSHLARTADADKRLLVGYKGQEPVGLFPIFEATKGPFRMVYSPPPHLEVYYLGPVLLNFEKLKQRKAERRHRTFIEQCLDWIDERIAPDYIDVRTVDRHTDLRPFSWEGFDVSPSYTYLVDLESDDLLMQFSRDARSNIRDRDDVDCTIRDGDTDALETIIGQVQQRHDDQGKEYRIDPAFVVELSELLPEGCVRPYVCEHDGEIVGGIVTLEYGDTIYRWQGGVKHDVGFSVNDLLDWQIMQDAQSRGRSRYDLVGANLPRLCRYKSKFGPEPAAYYTAQRKTTRMKAVTGVYRRLPSTVKVISE
ncbi:lipid II:glycine glycyltransferase FemX [Haladaptatus caseinilyticus]|uniref:lipid II:glycine glycyltransferase FemX n=1 Tax=Haladaptatus caseinilyticus TaxID=2993314 RepID=UPI00224A67F1|nr:GNAT family N-acetyltransferase [Haladaptatus caseinilyticus]